MNRADMMSPEKIAAEYGGDKRKIAEAAQMGVISPTVAVMAGMFIDRMRSAAATEQTPSTTVAEDVMAARQAPAMQQGQEPSQGLAALPVDENMVPGGEGYAGGGIVAFAGEGESLVSGDGYYTADPFLTDYVTRRETGSYKGDPNFAVSPQGAIGKMQIMPKTAMKPGFGVKNIFDMADDFGIPYKGRTKESAEKLLNNEALNVTFGKSYLGAMQRRFKDPVLAAASYNAGPGAVTRAGGVPNIPETQRYVSGLQAAAATEPRTALRERSIWEKLSPISSAEASELPPTEGQRRAFLQSQFDKSVDETTAPKENWQAKHISDLTKAFGVLPSMAETGFRKLVGAPNTRDWAAPEEGTPATEGTPANMRQQADANQQLFSDILYGRQPVPRRSEDPTLMQEATPPAIAAQQAKAAPAAAAAAQESDYMSELRKSLADRTAAIAKQRDEDKAMALLTAGLGIMGGKSQYALQNIGAGALKGAEYLSQARKQQREEEQDILAGRLGLAKVGAEEKYRQEVLKDRAAGRAIQEKGLQSKMAEVRRKAQTDWDSGPGLALIKSFNKKDWQNDAKLKGEYNLAKARYVNSILEGTMAELDVPLSTER